jgi:hypothetical protein
LHSLLGLAEFSCVSFFLGGRKDLQLLLLLLLLFTALDRYLEVG